MNTLQYMLPDAIPGFTINPIDFNIEADFNDYVRDIQDLVMEMLNTDWLADGKKVTKSIGEKGTGKQVTRK